MSTTRGIYFGHAEEAARTIDRAADPTRVARAGYAYAHGVMVAGVIVFAVNRLVLSAGATLVVATLAAATGTSGRSGAHAAAETSS